MADLKTVEAEAKEIAAETTSVISSLIGTWNPRWPRFVETWKGWSLRKKGIALVVAASVCGFVSAFGVSTLRLLSGSYRSAYAYGHGENVTRDDVTASIKGLSSKADIADLQSQIDAIKSDIASMDDRFDKAEAAKITTGSITPAKRKKTAPVKSSASSWFQLP